MRYCLKCSKFKELDDFHKNKSRSDGLADWCKSCRKNYQKTYKPPKTYRNSVKLYQRAYQRVYGKTDRCKLTKKIYVKKKMETDPLFKLRGQLRCMIRRSLRNKGYSRTSKSTAILGADFATIKAHLEATFQTNYGIPYSGQLVHIDHIIPISSARTEEQLLALNHYKNLQYLTPHDNLTKSSKLIWSLS